MGIQIFTRMNQAKTLLLLGLVLTLLCLIHPTKASDPESSPAPESLISDIDSESDADLDELGNMDFDDELHDIDTEHDKFHQEMDSPDEDWQRVIETTLANKDAYHIKDTILNLAYVHLVYEDLDELSVMRLKHQGKETKLNDDESASLTNAMVVKAYVDE